MSVKGGLPSEVPLTPQERNAIRALKRLMKTWPASLWLFVDGDVRVMRMGDDGKHAPTVAGMPDRDYVVDSIEMDCDGGGW